mmetsp:Transcript_58884/g.131468  ORF Transcript_58884/g.131468 Transcript_58884/m.131468 type:complete len:537 (-) Transcript_58884:4-1614(-)
MAGNDVCMYDPYQDISDEFGWHQSPGVPAEAQPEPEIDGVEEANMDVQDLEEEEADPGNTLEDEVDWGDEEAADGAEAAEGGEGEEGREGGEGGEGGAETKLEATDPADSQQVPADSISLVEDDDECQIVSVDIIQPAPEPEVQKGKGKGKGKGKKETSPATLKAVLRIQAAIRGWKARLDVHPQGPKEKSRTLNDGEQLVLSLQNISLKNVPDVNTFGGVDPFVEVQCGFSKDPDSKGKTTASAEKSAKTEILAGNNPKFSKPVEMTKVYNKPDQFLNFLLFDSGSTEDTFIGSKSVSVNKLLEGIKAFTLDSPMKPIQQELELKAALTTDKTIKAKFQVVVFEAMKFNFKIKQGEKFPEVDQFGGIDSFIEIRATRKNVRKEDFSLEPDDKCVWSAKTNVHPDTVSPKYDQELKAVLPGDPSLLIQIILWDSNAPMADYPVGHHVMDIQEEICHKQNLDPLEHIIKFQKIPGQATVPGYNKATLKFSLQTSLAEEGTPPPPPAKAKAKAAADPGPKPAAKSGLPKGKAKAKAAA